MRYVQKLQGLQSWNADSKVDNAVVGELQGSKIRVTNEGLGVEVWDAIAGQIQLLK